MLRGIKNVTSNWIGKTIMALVMAVLVFSFAIWGIGDIFRGFGQSTVATIGKTEISIEQFRRTYTERLRQISQQLGRPISPSQARALGFGERVLGQIVAEAALDERVRQLGLAIPDAEIAKKITADPGFRGATGQFDRVRFEQILRNIGYNEQRYVSEQRNSILRAVIAQSVTAGTIVPKAAIDVVNRFENEQRAIEFVTLSPAQAGEIPPPTPEQLTKFFDERKTLFRAPEYRKAVLLSLVPEQLAPWIEVSDADAKKFYDDNRSRFVTPERRQMQQIVFPSPEEATTAADRITKGAKFADVAKERGLKESDIEIGTLAKSAVADKAIAEAAFNLKPDVISAPIKGRFGTALVRVVKIEPEKVRPYEEAASEIKRDIALETAKNRMLDSYDKIEDERAAGLTLPEIAKKLKLQVRTIDAIDRSGRDPSGQPVANVPEAARLLPLIFATDVGVESDPLQSGDGYVWYEVAATTPSRERKLDEVKADVESRWRDHEIAERLKAKAKEIVDKLKAGDKLADVATANGLTLQSVSGLKRGQSNGGVPARVVNDVFRTAKGAAATSAGETPTTQFVFRVTDIVEPKLDSSSADAKRITEALEQGFSNDVVAEYLMRLESDLNVSINQTAVSQVVGTEAN